MILFRIESVVTNRSESNVWIDKPTFTGDVLYSIVTPAICSVAVCGNIISLITLSQKEFVSSIYTYLTVLATTDLINSIILFTSGLFRGILYNYGTLAAYDALIFLPLSGAISCISVVATVLVAIDRVIFLWDPMTVCVPTFCRKIVARKLTAVSIIVSILFNIPYCFIYKWNDDNQTLSTTDFFHSTFYMVHNWIKLTIFCIIPGILLIIGNALLLRAVKKALRYREDFSRSALMKRRKLRRSKEQISLTVILILVVLFFLIGEVPTHFISRVTASVILYGGNEEKANKSIGLEVCRQVFTVLNSINLAINFILYILLFEPFRRSLINLFCTRTEQRKSKTRPSNIQVNIFLIDNHRNVNNNLDILVPIQKILNTFDATEKTNAICALDGSTSNEIDLNNYSSKM